MRTTATSSPSSSSSSSFFSSSDFFFSPSSSFFFSPSLSIVMSLSSSSFLGFSSFFSLDSSTVVAAFLSFSASFSLAASELLPSFSGSSTFSALSLISWTNSSRHSFLSSSVRSFLSSYVHLRIYEADSHCWHKISNSSLFDSLIYSASMFKLATLDLLPSSIIPSISISSQTSWNIYTCSENLIMTAKEARDNRLPSSPPTRSIGPFFLLTTC